MQVIDSITTDGGGCHGALGFTRDTGTVDRNVWTGKSNSYEFRCPATTKEVFTFEGPLVFTFHEEDGGYLTGPAWDNICCVHWTRTRPS